MSIVDFIIRRFEGRIKDYVTGTVYDALADALDKADEAANKTTNPLDNIIVDAVREALNIPRTPKE